MGFLDRVREYKIEEAERLEPSAFGDREKGIFNPLEFLGKHPVIAEVKMASPSAGNIREVEPVKQALSYQEGGAGAISVLTDERFFRGSWDYLRQVADAVKLPVLCKEFVLSEKQIDAAYRCGADFVLFIYGFVEDRRLQELISYAKSLGLFVLLEVFSPENLEGALRLEGADMLGVNSRNLQDLSVCLERAVKMLVRVPDDRFKVAESGIRTIRDAALLMRAGADALLIGEMLMRAEEPSTLLREMNDVCKNLRRKRR